MMTFAQYFQNHLKSPYALNEAKVVIPDRGKEPIHFGDTIRVYHGFRDTRDALDAAKVGMSGKEKASRVYSYESNNNPTGIFVSSSLKIAKEFTGAYENITVIAELHAPESDLEIPVWPGGSYTTQGGVSEYWSNDLESNNIQRKVAQKEKIQWILDQAKKQGLDWVLQSDRPDLAWFLQMGGESQALFTGDIDPTSIRAFWIRGKGSNGYQSINDPFTRISRKEFINKIESTYDVKNLKRDPYDKKGRKKIFSPRERFDSEKLLNNVGRGDRDDALDTIKNLVISGYDPEEILTHYLWANQMNDAKTWWNSLVESKNNNFSQLDLMDLYNSQRIIYESYTPRTGDIFYHGSPKDFESINPDENGLVYLTRDLDHATEFAAGRSENFGGKLSDSGYVYAYRIDPSAKIINAKDDENLRGLFRKGFSSDYGYTEIIQQPDVINKILSQGWDGILQRQANLDLYDNRVPKTIKRHQYSRREGKERWREKMPHTPNYTPPYKGSDVLGIKPGFLQFLKRIAYADLEGNPKEDVKKFKYE